jgi:hypothetical protein
MIVASSSTPLHSGTVRLHHLRYAPIMVHAARIVAGEVGEYGGELGSWWVSECTPANLGCSPWWVSTVENSDRTSVRCVSWRTWDVAP